MPVFTLQFPANVNIANLNGGNGFAVTGFPSSGEGGCAVNGGGDVNADGTVDLIIGANYVSPCGNACTGESYVIFGKSGLAPSGSLSASSLTGTSGIAITGFSASVGYGGQSVSCVGDINGDGIADLAIGAPGNYFWTTSYGGQVYVIFGKSGLGSTGAIDVSTLSGSNGFVINGIPNSSEGGSSISSAGDINGDGIADLVIGAPTAPSCVGGNPNTCPGISYVIFGKSGVGGAGSLSVSSLTGSNGFTFTGFSTVYSYNAGAAVSIIGDINADGKTDLVVATPVVNTSPGYVGACYVIFGNSALGSSGSFDVSTINGSNGFFIKGFTSNGCSTVAGAGDVNKDGVADLVVGSVGVGKSYVIFGKTGIGSSGTFDVSTLTGPNGFAITSSGTFSSVSGAGDINSDGIADLLLGGNSASYVIFGKIGIGNSGSFDVSTLTGANGFAISSLPSAVGSVSGAGDVNKDGIVDLIVGTPLAFSGSGASYVIFGEKADSVNVINNSLLINEGQTLVFNSQYLNATSLTQPAKYLTLQFTVTGIQHGRFFATSNPSVSLTSFLQQQVYSGQIQFAHDGTGWAPAYGVSVGYANLFASTPAQAAVINFKQSFVLVNNNLVVNKGQTVIVTSSSLSANDLYNSANNPNLVFSVSQVQHGYFAFTSSPSTSITSFTQAQVQSGNVQFVHDGSINPPSYSVAVINGASSTVSQLASVSFDVPPTLVTNALMVNQGETVVLTLSNLSASDPYSSSFTFTVSNVQHGYFALTSTPTMPMTSFTQAQLQNAQVQFIHDGSVNAPSYWVSVSDGRMSSGVRAGIISFHPILSLIRNTITLNAGQSMVLTPQNLNATALDGSSPAQIIFTVADVTDGYFAYVDYPALPIFSFSQADIDTGQVEFVSDGSQRAPSYSIAVSDGTAVLDPVPAAISFGDAPQILVNQITISQGGTQFLDLDHLHADGKGATNSTLLFFVNNVHHGHFEDYGQPSVTIGNFTQQQIINHNIQFVHDGSNFAPSYLITAFNSAGFSSSVTKSAFYVSTFTASPPGDYSAASPAKIWFHAGGLTLPTLKYNRLYIVQGGKTVLSPEELVAVNAQGSPVFNTTFLINGLTHGQFTSVVNPTTSYLNFSQSQVAAGDIQFVHDGSANTPSYEVVVNQGPYYSAPYPASIAFRPIYTPPQIIGQLSDQMITVDEAFSFPLTTSVFSDTTPLHFSASTTSSAQLPSWIHFDNVTNYFSGMATTPGMTSIQVTAKDAAHLTASTFFLLTAQAQSHAASHNTTLIGGVVGGVAVLMLIAMRCYLGRKAYQHWQQAIDTGATQKITRVLAKEIFEKVKLTGCCGYLDESTAKVYIKAIEDIVSKLDLVNKTQPISWIDEIATQIKKQANKSYCYSFFKPEISPQELSDKAETIAQSVQYVLSAGVGESTPRSDDVEMSDVRVLSA